MKTTIEKISIVLKNRWDAAPRDERYYDYDGIQSLIIEYSEEHGYDWKTPAVYSIKKAMTYVARYLRDEHHLHLIADRVPVKTSDRYYAKRIRDGFRIGDELLDRRAIDNEIEVRKRNANSNTEQVEAKYKMMLETGMITEEAYRMLAGDNKRWLLN